MTRAILLAVTAVFLVSCDFLAGRPDPIRITGETMGTTYSVTVVDVPDGMTAETLQQEVEAVLADVNGKMSNWDPNSEVSKFNDARSVEPIPVSEDFLQVVTAANAVHELSGGKFDVTLAPLISLWGFGPKKPGEPVPSDPEIAAALRIVGQMTMLAVSAPDGTVAKTDPEVSINLSAIAKGFGVDQVAATLQQAGVENYLVEIGGDLVTAGKNAQDEPWSIGVERPDGEKQDVELIVPVSDLGLATSGDYRNYFEEDGVRYSHIIDPTTGRPITHSTASVTVVAENAMMADALATALLVTGADTGLTIADENGIAVLFMSRRDGVFRLEASNAFEKIVSID